METETETDTESETLCWSWKLEPMWTVGAPKTLSPLGIIAISNRRSYKMIEIQVPPTAAAAVEIINDLRPSAGNPTQPRDPDDTCNCISPLPVGHKTPQGSMCKLSKREDTLISAHKVDQCCYVSGALMSESSKMHFTTAVALDSDGERVEKRGRYCER